MSAEDHDDILRFIAFALLGLDGMEDLDVGTGNNITLADMIMLMQSVALCAELTTETLGMQGHISTACCSA